jgi:hypothetical protein
MKKSPMIDSKNFNEHRNILSEEFNTESIFYKRKITQGAFWTAIDKDLANQYFRDECWLFNIKYKDELKFIDHGIDINAPTNSGIGFGKK